MAEASWDFTNTIERTQPPQITREPYSNNPGQPQIDTTATQFGQPIIVPGVLAGRTTAQGLAEDGEILVLPTDEGGQFDCDDNRLPSTAECPMLVDDDDIPSSIMSDIENIMSSIRLLDHDQQHTDNNGPGNDDSGDATSSETKEVEELRRKISKYEEEIKGHEELKKKEHREHKKQMCKVTRRAMAVKEDVLSQAELITGLKEQLKEKDIASENVKTQLAKCNRDLSMVTEERNVVTSEYRNHIGETGRITNEMTGVLGERENMAKQYYTEKFNLVNRLRQLGEDVQRKQCIIDKLVSEVEQLENQEVAVTIGNPTNVVYVRAPPIGRRINEWMERRFGNLWRWKVFFGIVILSGTMIFLTPLIFPPQNQYADFSLDSTSWPFPDQGWSDYK